jgi:hypothetical protein
LLRTRRIPFLGLTGTGWLVDSRRSYQAIQPSLLTASFLGGDVTRSDSDRFCSRDS